MIAPRLGDLDGRDAGGEEDDRRPLDARETRGGVIDIEYGCWRITTFANPTSTTSSEPNTCGHNSITWIPAG